MRLYRIATEQRLVYLTAVSTVHALQFYCRFYKVNFEDLSMYTQAGRVIKAEWPGIYYEEKDENGEIVKVTVPQILKLPDPHIIKVIKNDGSFAFTLRRFNQ